MQILQRIIVYRIKLNKIKKNQMNLWIGACLSLDGRWHAKYGLTLQETRAMSFQFFSVSFSRE